MLSTSYVIARCVRARVSLACCFVITVIEKGKQYKHKSKNVQKLYYKCQYVYFVRRNRVCRRIEEIIYKNLNSNVNLANQCVGEETIYF